MSAVPQSNRSKKLSMCLAAGLVVAPAASICTTRIVDTCADDGSGGSLRKQISAASSGDTIDLSTAQLTCSTITLATGAGFGEIAIPQNYLTLKGPSSRTVTITTAGTYRLLHHTGLKLEIDYLTLTGGYYERYNSDAKGGCIYSSDEVVLQHASVVGCTAYSFNGVGVGGGVWAFYVRMDHSTVSGNLAYSFSSDARGGGIRSSQMRLEFSTLSGNRAAGVASLGGGAYAIGSSAVVLYSTIDSNSAQQGGGLFLNGNAPLSIAQSTLSGNMAALRGGGATVIPGIFEAAIENSTVAFNSAPNAGGIYSKSAIDISSSILAKNASTSSFADLYSQGTPSGSNNLIASYNIAGPVGFISATGDPRLAPLANHGGPTRTHALLSTSPALDHGSSPAGFTTDQRGPGFARVVNGTADIGAYERQIDDDEIFYDGFN